jgi:glycosyltransferase involved in cell wall biosynthesis
VAAISVIITVFNREIYLREAIASVLGQTRPTDEIIVIDDGSTDGSAEVARSFGPPVRCLSQANGGMCAARNAGLAAARGDLIAFLDSDDLWIETKLEAQARFLADNPELDLVFCRMKPFLSPEIERGQVPLFDDREVPGHSCSGLLARREIFDRTGGFSTDLRLGELVDWFGRAEQQGIRFGVLPELLFMRRVHLGNNARNHEAKVDYLRALKRQIDRRRAAGEGEK